MRSWRNLLGIVGLFLLLGLTLAPGIAQAARAQAASGVQAASAQNVWVEVNPSTVTAGRHVVVRADCGDDSTGATVTSPAFGPVVLKPLDTYLQAEALVGASTREGGYDVRLACRNGPTATTTMWVVNRPEQRPTMGPHTGGGFLAKGGTGGRLADRLTGPTGWLVGAGMALTAAIALGLVSTRRAARATRAVRPERPDRRRSVT